MHSNPVEAAMVATLMVVLYLVTRGLVPLPKRFSLQAVVGWIAVVAGHGG
jgi:hypothetical protein